MASTYALPGRAVSHNHTHDHDHAHSQPTPDSPYALKSFMNGRSNGRADLGRPSSQSHRHKRNVSINFGFAPIQEKEATTAPPPEYVNRGCAARDIGIGL